MEEQKTTYYLNIESGEVLNEPAEPEGHFRLLATSEEIGHLREALDKNYNADMKTFGKAHVPFADAHEENREYDNTMKEVYSFIYKLGDREARDHVLGMGILDESELDR